MQLRDTCLFFVLAVLLFACNKTAFLNASPDSTLFVPDKLPDFQALLDNATVMGETPELGELSSDDYYLTTPFWLSLYPIERNGYIWSKDIYESIGNVADWDIPYKQIFYANVVLSGLEEIPVTKSNRLQWNTLRGSALFFRSYAFFNLVQIFAQPYDDGNAHKYPGIPLKISPAIEEKIQRSTVAATYERMLEDLAEAKLLLPEELSSYSHRPAKPAALALLARIYLAMREYDNAWLYADSVLQRQNTLMDYNDLHNFSFLPFPKQNPEVLYPSKLLVKSNVFKSLVYPECIVDSVLHSLYSTEDIRGTTYFTNMVSGHYNMNGNYNDNIFPFTGLAVDEMYLVRAEGFARKGNVAAAMQDLNNLLVKRIKKGSFAPLTAASSQQALNLVLMERRKELVFRGLRWTDIRRLNLEGADIVLTRKVNGQTYQLLPGDKRYVLPIPPDIIAFSGIEQNPR